MNMRAYPHDEFQRLAVRTCAAAVSHVTPWHKKKPPESFSPEALKKAATYSPTLRCSTIGALGLNFSVRDGKRWSPEAETTKLYRLSLIGSMEEEK